MPFDREQIRQRAARGFAWCNRRIPDWRNSINPRILDMSNNCRCIGGQLERCFGDFRARYKLSLRYCVTLGFCVPYRLSSVEVGEYYRLLTEEWRKLLNENPIVNIPVTPTEPGELCGTYVEEETETAELHTTPCVV